MTPPTGRSITCTRLDAHVHLHPRFDAAAFLDHAARNARGNAALCFTECAGVNRFTELRDASSAGEWLITPTAEPESLIARRGEHAVILIAGRQVITAERLEVLAVAADSDVADGQPLGTTIDATLAAGALPVLPWAFGKWTGARGRAVASCIESRSDVFVADQAGRPAGTPEPPILALARERGLINLSGSDPLDLPRHVARPASFGCTLTDGGSDTFELDAQTPADDLRAKLARLTTSPPIRGSRVSPIGFVRDQVALRLAKRSGRPA
ncbi:MAG: hypothetical protein RIB60_10655 [Phycisphaerales bacterium]